jgi:hypothetical protein
LNQKSQSEERLIASFAFFMGKDNYFLLFDAALLSGHLIFFKFIAKL